ncbi:amino acid permease [Mucilaginibacter sp. FT3.2]|uniref:amino acid permease n=1 Tax=Mucilaginibacter sp. FT3.2 TaxID=2723090 RepID=UPI001621C62D|nr:amino acid permease [Mucilaginibacter sp. FT3.2]MBB6232848.1 APA family basic amino acid/polyamine antiporter [Mucilaginibacter sp. FT3.2]
MPESTKKLGLWTSTSLVVGNMIGAGVFLMPAAMAGFGSIGLLGWVFSAIGSFFLAKVFSNMSKLLPHATGGPYAFTRNGLGDFAGFLVAWGYFISTSCACAAITKSLVSALSTFFPTLANNNFAAISTGLCAIWLLTYINTRGVVTSGKWQLVTTILKILPLLLVAVGGLFFLQAKNFLPFNSSGFTTYGAISATAAMTMFSFIGIECATIPSGSVENPEKTVPRATLLGLLIATLVYILGSISVMGIIPAIQLQHSQTPYADAAAVIFGNGARYWVSAGVAIAAFGALNGWTLMQGQMPFAVANDKLFPAIFGKQNKKGVPYVGILLSSTLVSLFMSMNYTKSFVEQFRFLLLLSLLSMLIPYLLSAASYLIIRVKNKQVDGWLGAVFLAIIAFSYALWNIVGTGKEAVYYGFILLMISVPFYVWVAYKKSSE